MAAYRKFNVWARPYGLSKHRLADQHATFSRNWYLFDCKWQDAFDAAGMICRYLMGKHKPIYDHHQNMGDHVVCINTKQLSMPDDEWRYRMYYHHSRYQRGRTWSPAFELHINDPTIVLYKACYKLCGSIPDRIQRRDYMARLHLYPEEAPKEKMEMIIDQIRGTNRVLRSIEEFTPEEKANFPKITDYPDDYVIPDPKK
jgi:large subunit ribosomal protein L13